MSANEPPSPPPHDDQDPFAKLGPRRRGAFGRLRNWFLGGVLVTAPVGITIWITWGLIDFVDRRVHPFIPRAWDPERYLPFSVPGLGFLLVIGSLILVGMFAAGLLGRWVMRMGELLLARVPIVRSIYSALKQVFETLLASNARAFREVVLVEYPYRGIWAIAFVTAQTKGEVQRLIPEDVVSLFLPAVPNPTTGFLLFVPRDEIRPLDMTVEQGLKLVISGGIVTPPPGGMEPPLPPVPVPARPVRLGLMARLRNYLLAGILVTAPAAITFWLVWHFVTFVDSRVNALIPLAWRPETYLPTGVPGLGVVLAVAGLTLIGMLAAGIIGRWILRTSSWVFARLPVIRSIYGALKQIVETILASRSDAFRECVLFQYPRKGSWVVGFLTGKTEGQIQGLTEEEVINVFMPTTPNPTSGFLMFVPRRDVLPLSMTIEEGLKLVISGGLVVPPDRGALLEEEAAMTGRSGDAAAALRPRAAGAS